MTDDPGFRPETLSTYEPTPDEVAARRTHIRRSPFLRMLRGEITAERYTAIWRRYFRMFPNGPWRA